jgi:hypothetical protein
MKPDMKPTGLILVQHRAVLDPVPVVAIPYTVDVADAWMMNVATDNAIQAVAQRRSGGRMLETADIPASIRDLILDPIGERPGNRNRSDAVYLGRYDSSTR